MKRFLAIFDGKILIPEGNLYFLIGKVLELTVRDAEGEAGDGGKIFDIHPETRLPVFRVPAGTKMISLEDIRQAEEEEDLRYIEHFRKGPEAGDQS